MAINMVDELREALKTGNVEEVSFELLQKMVDTIVSASERETREYNSGHGDGYSEGYSSGAREGNNYN